VDEYKFRIACAYNYRNIRAKSLQALIAWRHHFNEFIELRADIVKVFRFEHFLRRRFLAFRIIVTRERLLRRAVRRYCRKSIIIVFYRWLYQSRWLKYKLVSRTNVIIALRKNLMTQRLMKLNWRTIIKKKVRLESAKKNSAKLPSTCSVPPDPCSDSDHPVCCNDVRVSSVLQAIIPGTAKNGF
jgi:hypothetical protein